MRAASVVPSFNGINVCSMTRTVRGKVVTITADAPPPAQSSNPPGSQPIRPMRRGQDGADLYRTLCDGPLQHNRFSTAICRFLGWRLKTVNRCYPQTTAPAITAPVQCNPTQA